MLFHHLFGNKVYRIMKAQKDNMQPIIHVDQLTKTYSFHEKQEGFAGSIKALFHRKMLSKTAVDHVSFDISSGEFVGFIGENGAGKTTTLKMLSGILTPSSGTVLIDGHVPIDREESFLKKISIVMGQKSSLWETLPPMETFLLLQKIYEIPNGVFHKRIETLAVLLDVTEQLHVQVRKLSLGQRMKFELIAALLHDPKIVFLDEPTIGLDVTSQHKIREFLLEHNRTEKTTIILTSHNMSDVERLCKRLIIINKGAVGYDGSLEDIVASYSQVKHIRVQFRDRILKKDLSKIGTVIEMSPFEARLTIPSNDVSKQIQRLFSDFSVDDISIQDVSLEEIVADIFQDKN